ncbi:hypothetical protein [Niallia circulans]|uniref:hypothetical protein n=1 Tax=Niallia circulans TaxID=1397 RepID=UPI001F378B1A|nr:hypothetical protein [Niallia circulans]MCF2650882.1 hypothetical protein [Niallia circulans]
MKFLNFEHQQRFNTLREELPEGYMNDIERKSLIYLMAGNKELEAWFEGFSYEDMFKQEDFSSELKVLANLAVVLYNHGLNLDFSDVFTMLDKDNLELALCAARYRYGVDKKDIYEIEDGNSYLK